MRVMSRFGTILVDWGEVVMCIYQKEVSGWKEVYTGKKELLNPEAAKGVRASEFAEAVSAFARYGERLQVTKWKICARYIPSKLTQDIAESTGFDIEHLDLPREQKLLCQGYWLE